MGLSRSTKIWILLAIDVIFFFIELIVGYAVGSLALVADSFHMLNDVMSLIVALYAIKLSANSSSAKYSYGWHRAEILAALINGVFLLFLCLSIFLEAIERFFSVPEISNPDLVVIVGCWGLASNIFGLVLFHEHGHGRSHDHGHDTSESGGVKTPSYPAEPASDTTPLLSSRPIEPESPKIGHRRTESVTINRRRSESISNEPVLVHPAQVRASLVQAAEDLRVSSPEPGKTGPMSPHHKHSRSQSMGSRMGKVNHPISIEGASQADLAHRPSANLHNVHEEDYDRAERGNNFGLRNDEAVCSDDEDAPPNSGVHSGHSHSAPQRSAGHSHSGHSHGGHSHGSMNMHALILHVLGDALGNVGVIATGLIIGHTDWDFKYYFDPIISLVITVIIFVNAMPLVKSASFILLQGVPPNVDLEDVREAIVALPGVLSVHELHIWQLSETKNVASVHVLVRRAPLKGQLTASDASSTTAGGDGKNKMVMRNNKDGTVIRDLPETDEFMYMSVAADIRRVLHEFGIHSSTIQPEYCIDGSDDDEASARSVCLLACPADMDCEANKCCSTTIEH